MATATMMRMIVMMMVPMVTMMIAIRTIGMTAIGMWTTAALAHVFDWHCYGH